MFIPIKKYVRVFRKNQLFQNKSLQVQKILAYLRRNVDVCQNIICIKVQNKKEVKILKMKNRIDNINIIKYNMLLNKTTKLKSKCLKMQKKRHKK